MSLESQPQEIVFSLPHVAGGYNQLVIFSIEAQLKVLHFKIASLERELTHRKTLEFFANKKATNV